MDANFHLLLNLLAIFFIGPFIIIYLLELFGIKDFEYDVAAMLSFICAVIFSFFEQRQRKSEVTFRPCEGLLGEAMLFGVILSLVDSFIGHAITKMGSLMVISLMITVSILFAFFFGASIGAGLDSKKVTERE